MSRLGTPYQQTVFVDDTYSITLRDDLIIATDISGGKTATLPDPASATGDNGTKSIANLATSGGTLTLATAAGQIIGTTSLLVGEATTVQSDGISNWVAENKFSAEGVTAPAISSALSVADSAASAAVVADSKGVSSGTAASAASSMGNSAAVIAVSASSQAVSAGTRASAASSMANSAATLADTADSKGVSAGVRASSAAVNAATADSKGVSAGVLASAASSTGSSNSLGISALTSRVSSKGG